MTNAEDLQKLLEQIGAVAYEASLYARELNIAPQEKSQALVTPNPDQLVCCPCSLPESRSLEACKKAIEIHSGNAPTLFQLNQEHGDRQIVSFELLSLHTKRFWNPTRKELSVSFLGQVSSELSARILKHLNAWNEVCLIHFCLTDSIGDVRISLESTGNWSYLGTDILLIPPHQATTNFMGLSESLSEKAFSRIVQHQAGHLLGLPHHPTSKTYQQKLVRDHLEEYLQRLLGEHQSKATAAQIYDPTLATDQVGLMSWQFPSTVTSNQTTILGPATISPLDLHALESAYPKNANKFPG